MGTLADTEILVELAGKNVEYKDVMMWFDEKKKNSFDNVRHLMALAYQFAGYCRESSYMALGSLGILGNIVAAEGVGAISRFGPIHDVDVLVKESFDSGLVKTVFDEVDCFCKSPTVGNKMTVRGRSVDNNGNETTPVSIDVNVVYPDGLNLSTISGTPLHEGNWEECVSADFFGILVQCAPVVSLLEMKLGVVCSDRKPREKDRHDIYNLVGLLEMRDADPVKIKNWISPFKRDRLRNVLSEGCNYANGKTIMIKSSDGYRRALSR